MIVVINYSVFNQECHKSIALYQNKLTKIIVSTYLIEGEVNG